MRQLILKKGSDFFAWFLTRFCDYSVEGGKKRTPREKSENRAARQAKTRDRPNSPVFTKKEGVHRERNTAAVEHCSGKEGGGATFDGARSAPGREAAL